MKHDNLDKSSKRSLDDILNECIDRILAGETVEQCLEGHREQALELEPLLRSAATAHKAASAQPDPQFRTRARSHVLSKVHADVQDVAFRKPRRIPILGWQPRWAVTAAFAFIFLLVAGSSTVAASSGAMPDDVLYPVKLRVEDVRLRLAFSNEAKADLHAKFAERRVQEIIFLAGRDTTDDESPELLRTRARLRSRLQAIERLAIARQQQLGQDDSTEDELVSDQQLAKLRAILQDNNEQTDTAFQEAQQRLPVKARVILQSALEEYRQQYQEALEATGDSTAESSSDEDNSGDSGLNDEQQSIGLRDKLRNYLRSLAQESAKT